MPPVEGSDAVLALDQRFARELPGLCTPAQPAALVRPEVIVLNTGLADELGFDAREFSADLLRWLRAGRTDAPVQAVAQAYAGHQFGHFVPSLGDGRALLLGEWVDGGGRRWDLGLKGSGRTAFARGGDGKAVLGPMLREYLMGEALHGLRIPTTRVLAVVGTGESILREGGPQPGALLVRVASSHLRVGSFQYAAARGDRPLLEVLLRHAIERHYPQCATHESPALALLECVSLAQARLLARWMHAGFLHGVMNTDNMALGGQTIDFGPCAWIDRYDPETVYSSIDHAGRYAFGRQPAIARWNLARLAECLLVLVGRADDADGDAAVDRLNSVLEGFGREYEREFLRLARLRMGWIDEHGEDAPLVSDFLLLLEQQGADLTLSWRALADLAQGKEQALRQELREPAAADAWIALWRQRPDAQDPQARARSMRMASALYVPRNHLVEGALQAAVDRADLDPLHRLTDAVRHPFQERGGWEELASPAPEAFTRNYRTTCGT